MGRGIRLNGKYLYEQLVEKLICLIENGTLKPGDKLLSVRRQSINERMSQFTVLQAYGVLEDRGFIAARPQSGFYVKLQQSPRPPEPKKISPPLLASRVKVSQLVAEVHQSINDPTILPLGAAAPSPALLPVTKLNRTLGAIIRRAGSRSHTYEITEGNYELRGEIARRAYEYGCSLSSDDIIITFGCTEALNLCLRAVARPGDILAVESPTYYGLLQIIESLGMSVVEIPTDPRRGVSLDALESAIKRHPIRACVFMPTFHNPLGSCMSESDKKELVQLLTRKNIPLIEDDVYGDLCHEKGRPKPAKAFDKEGIVMLCDSFSKTISPGYRIGWTAPGRYVSKVTHLKLTNTVSTATLPQLVIAEILSNGGYDRHLRAIRRSYGHNVDMMTRAIMNHFPKQTRITRPQGGFVLWVELPRSVNALSLYRKAIQEKISIVPGHLFSPRRCCTNFIRISCGEPWSHRLEEGVTRLARLIDAELSASGKRTYRSSEAALEITYS